MSSSSPPIARLGAGQPAMRRPRGLRLRQGSTPYLFLAPFVILFLLFFIGPILYAFKLSLFTLHRHPSLNGATNTTTFGGLNNYQRAFGDADFLSGLKNMIAFGIVQVPVMLFLALTFALVLDSPFVRLKAFFRLSYFIPFAIPGVVATLLWGYFYTPSLSPVTGLFTKLSFGNSPNFFQPVSHLLASVGNIVTWEWAGYNMVILIAALQSVSAEIYEAAGLDGCGPIRTALFIKIPLLQPALVLTAVFSIIGTLQLFNEFSVFNQGGLAAVEPSVTPNYYAYTQAFTYGDFNYAATISFALALVTFVFSFAFLKLTSRGGE
ncbi:MAG TPA: sugar ABC transporter permease [Chloroflexota bacterium]|nr:sugar ABC transporter permease [Chloroflexota bacterium]